MLAVLVRQTTQSRKSVPNMVRAIKQTVTVQAGGRVEVTSDQLAPGTEAEIIILIDTGNGTRSNGNVERSPHQARPIWEIAEELSREIPHEELSRLPTDLAAEHDHYLYGHPKLNP